MIIYNPHDALLPRERMENARALLEDIPAKHCFITGSFLYKEKYDDIDIFVVSRTKKKLASKDPKAKIVMLDFNDIHSLFYHSISMCCIAKDILPTKTLKITLSDYWHVISEAIPTLLNGKDMFHKNVRFLILYTEYFRTGEVLDTAGLAQKIDSLGDYKEIMDYIKAEVPEIIRKHATKSYAKRFFYTQAGYRRNLSGYDAQHFLYDLAHDAIKCAVHG